MLGALHQRDEQLGASYRIHTALLLIQSTEFFTPFLLLFTCSDSVLSQHTFKLILSQFQGLAFLFYFEIPSSFIHIVLLPAFVFFPSAFLVTCVFYLINPFVYSQSRFLPFELPDHLCASGDDFQRFQSVVCLDLFIYLLLYFSFFLNWRQPTTSSTNMSENTLKWVHGQMDKYGTCTIKKWHFQKSLFRCLDD